MTGTSRSSGDCDLLAKLHAERRALGQEVAPQMRVDPPLLVERPPREQVSSTVELGLLLEGPEPPRSLGTGEVEAIVGRPPQNFMTGEGGVPGFNGLRYFKHEAWLVYRRDDGRELTYAYEGALAWALVKDETP